MWSVYLIRMFSSTVDYFKTDGALSENLPLKLPVPRLLTQWLNKQIGREDKLKPTYHKVGCLLTRHLCLFLRRLY